MKVTLAFKKDAKRLDEKIIQWFLKCKYYHVEIIIKDKWISANPKYGVKIRDLEPLKESYDYIDIDVDGRKISKTLSFIKEQENKKYDWAGIIWSQIFKITRGQDQDKWFCSELVAEILLQLGQDKIKGHIPADISPKDLYFLYK